MNLKAAIYSILDDMPKLEATVIRLKFGIGYENETSNELIAHALGFSVENIEEISNRAIRMLKHPSRISYLQEYPDELISEDGNDQIQGSNLHIPASHIQTYAMVSKIKKLEPALIAHLKKHSNDLLSIDCYVMEHLVAELLAGNGFSDVRRVGANARTSADVFAGLYHHETGVEIRFFVEVKQVKGKIGVDVIDRVAGAILNERPTFGWTAAMIVSVHGFKNFTKYSPSNLKAMQIHLRDKEDLTKWLVNYKHTESGLLVPENPSSSLATL